MAAPTTGRRGSGGNGALNVEEPGIEGCSREPEEDPETSSPERGRGKSSPEAAEPDDAGIAVAGGTTSMLTDHGTTVWVNDRVDHGTRIGSINNNDRYGERGFRFSI